MRFVTSKSGCVISSSFGFWRMSQCKRLEKSWKQQQIANSITLASVHSKRRNNIYNEPIQTPWLTLVLEFKNLWLRKRVRRKSLRKLVSVRIIPNQCATLSMAFVSSLAHKFGCFIFRVTDNVFPILNIYDRPW